MAEAYYDQFHFAPAIKVGNRAYCSSVIGVGADGHPRTRRRSSPARSKVSSRCSPRPGIGFDKVVEMTTFHVGLRQHLATFMKVKDRYLAQPYPAWTAIGITELAFQAGSSEIKVIARLD